MSTSTAEPTTGDGRSGRMLPDVAPLAADAVLLHVGVHKTGTTAIQAALADARPQLREHSVYYPGRRRAHHRAALAVLQRPWGWTDKGAETFDRSTFDDLAARVQRHVGRVVVSSEFFCEASEESAAEVVRALGGERVHVVVTLRSLGALLPSSWQQYLKYGMATGYVKWLRNVFENPGGSSMTPTFWMRNDHAAVVARWAAAAGPENVTVIVLEDLDRRAMFRTFAQLLDVPADMLESRADLTSNRSMTAPEAQLLLDLNRRVALDVDWADYLRYVRRGLALGLVEGRQPPADEPRLFTPDWALESAAEMGTRAAASLRGLGVRILGDVDALGGIAPTGERTDEDECPLIATDVAVSAIVAVINAAKQPERVEEPSTRELADQLWGRVRAGGRTRRARRARDAP